MSEKLKPCPFCGGKNIAVRWTIGNNLWHAMCDNPKCRATGPWGLSKTKAIEAWNRRAYNVRS